MDNPISASAGLAEQAEVQEIIKSSIICMVISYDVNCTI